MDSKTSSMNTLALIAIPRRATTADLVQTVIANDTARRSQQGITSATKIRGSYGSGGGSGGKGDLDGSDTTTGPLVSAKIPSNRLFWLFIRRAIEEDPVGSQAPPLFMLTDSISKDSMMMNQKLFHELVVKYEEQGAGDAATAQRLLAQDGYVDSDGGQYYQNDQLEASHRSVTSGAHHQQQQRGVSESAGGGTNESFLFGLPSFLGFSGLGNSFGLKHMMPGSSSHQNSPSLAARNASMAPYGFGSSGGGGVVGGGEVGDSFALPPSASTTQYHVRTGINNSPSIYDTMGQSISKTSPHLRPATSAPSALKQLPGSGGSYRAGQAPVASSLLTVTVTASTGQLRTFRASQQFWDHVLLEYHNLLERQMHAAMDLSPRGTNKRRQSSAKTAATAGSAAGGGSPNRSPVGGGVRRTFQEEDDELSLLRSAQQEEQDRLVLTVTVNTYDAQRELAAQRRWLKKVNGGVGGISNEFGGLRSSLKKALDSSALNKQQQQQSLKVSFFGARGGELPSKALSGSSHYTDPLELSGRQDDDEQSNEDNEMEDAEAADDDDEEEQSINKVKSVQMFVSEWRQVVDAWDTATAVLLHGGDADGNQQATKIGAAKLAAAASSPMPFSRTATLIDDQRADLSDQWTTRPRSSAVVDPNTTEDLVHDAMRRMRSLEHQRRDDNGGDGGGSGLYWTHFMNHWKVLEAQYRNYL
ncbi:Hypothetical protein, putative [Bodo saltans]|uniref:Uncharacterized protein n=1 Tax=Bodo saltans TaxID=75058 RepID=A0A0S4JSQ1_BODSA|nr:Hypothetical protein, putative [Bodo saltans]|eukprot:CUG93605.1 Hypothetical protein, putative [Bodo saltans]